MKAKKLLKERSCSVRVTPHVFTQLQEEVAEGEHKNLSHLMADKIRTAFTILFGAAKEEDIKSGK